MGSGPAWRTRATPSSHRKLINTHHDAELTNRTEGGEPLDPRNPTSMRNVAGKRQKCDGEAITHPGVGLPGQYSDHHNRKVLIVEDVNATRAVMDARSEP